MKMKRPISTKDVAGIKHGMLMAYYVRAKNRILNSDDTISPFKDTVEEFFERDFVRNHFLKPGLLDENHLQDYLENLLTSAIRED